MVLRRSYCRCQSVRGAVLLVAFVSTTHCVKGKVGGGECEPSKIFAQPIALDCPGPKFGRPAVEWPAFGGELYEARNVVFSRNIREAHLHLAALLNLATSSAIVAFECPVAVATTAYALAETILITGDDIAKRMVLLLLHVGLAFLPMGGAQRICTQWPLRGRELAVAFMRLAGHPTARALPDTAPVAQAKRPRIVVVTACAGLHDRAAVALTTENRRLYAAMHGYDVVTFESADAVLAHTSQHSVNLTAINAPAFWRAYAAQAVFERTPGYEWLLWLDCEVLITDPQRTVQSLLQAHGAETGVSLVAAADGRGLKPEAWLLRASPWGRAFLHQWSSRLQRRPKGFGLSEREALRHAPFRYWAAWHGDREEKINWQQETWPKEVLLSPPADGPGGAGAFLAPQWLTRAEEGLPAALARQWLDGDFAWYEPSCQGGDLAGHQLVVCRQHRFRAHAAFIQRLPTDISAPAGAHTVA